MGVHSALSQHEGAMLFTMAPLGKALSGTSDMKCAVARKNDLPVESCLIRQANVCPVARWCCNVLIAGEWFRRHNRS